MTTLPKATHRISAVNIIKMPVTPCLEIEKRVLNGSGSLRDLEYQCIITQNGVVTKNRHIHRGTEGLEVNLCNLSHLILYFKIVNLLAYKIKDLIMEFSHTSPPLPPFCSFLEASLPSPYDFLSCVHHCLCPLS